MLDGEFINEFNNLKVNKKQIDFFDIIPPKEVLISKWIEFLLNPEINGVGNFPLQSLINLSNNFHNLNDYEFEMSDTEVSTDNQKRIDIILKFKGLWVVIENKIDSFENGEQTNEYYKYIEKTKGNNEVIYIYLKPNYNRSKPINDNFIIITYDKFINELKKISIDDYEDKNKFKYLNEFIISGGRFMKNEEIEITDTINFYVKEIDKFNAIEEEYNNKNKLLFDKITNSINDFMNDRFNGYLVYKSGNFIQIYKDEWNNSKHNGVHFEIIFNDSKLIGRKIDTVVLLHIECNTTDEQINAFKFVDITKHGSQAMMKGEPIKTNLKLDFSTNEEIEESINKMNNELFELAQGYENLIDSTMKI